MDGVLCGNEIMTGQQWMVCRVGMRLWLGNNGWCVVWEWDYDWATIDGWCVVWEWDYDWATIDGVSCGNEIMTGQQWMVCRVGIRLWLGNNRWVVCRVGMSLWVGNNGWMVFNIVWEWVHDWAARDDWCLILCGWVYCWLAMGDWCVMCENEFMTMR